MSLNGVMLLVNVAGIIIIVGYVLYRVKKRNEEKIKRPNSDGMRRLQTNELREQGESILSDSEREDASSREERRSREKDPLWQKIIAGEVLPAGTVIDHDLDLTDIDGIKNIVLDGVTIEGDVTLEDLFINKKVSLKGTIVKGSVNLDGASAEHFDLRGIIIKENLNVGCNAPQGIDLTGAVIDGDLNVEDVIFKGDVICTGMHLGGSFLSEDAEYPSTLDLTGAQIKDMLDLDGVKTGAVIAEKLDVGGECHLKNGTFRGKVNLRGATLHDFISVSSTTFEEDADFSGVTVKGDFDGENEGNGIECHGKFILSNSRIEGNLNLDSAKLESLNIQGARIEGDCYLQNAEVRQEFIYVDGTIDGDVNLSDAEINIFPGLTVKGSVNL